MAALQAPLSLDSPGKNTGVGCHFLLQCMKVKSESEVAQSCLTLSDPMDCSPPGSSIHGIFQARVLEWGAIAFSKDFCIVNKTEVDVFLELSCFFYDPTDVGNWIIGSSAFSKSSLNIWKFSVHVLLKPHLENFEHCFAGVWDKCNCVIIWTFFGIAFLWDWNENWPFPVLWPLLRFPNLLAYWVQHFNNIIFLGFEIAQLEFHHLH